MKKKSFKNRVLELFSSFVGRNYYFILAFYILLAVVSIYYTVNNLEFMTSRNDLISQHAKYYKDYKKYRTEFKDFDGMIVVVEGAEKQKTKLFVEELGQFLDSNPGSYSDVFYKIDTKFFNSSKLLFLEPDELKDLEERVITKLPFIKSLVRRPGLELYFEGLDRELTRSLGGEPEKIDDDEPVEIDEDYISLVGSILEQMVEYTKGEGEYLSPWQDVFIKNKENRDEEGYLTSNGGGFYFLFANPAVNEDDFAQAVDQIKMAREFIAKLELKYSGVTAGITGCTALFSDEMITSKDDTVKASFISLIGVSLLLVISLKGFILPLAAIFSLLISIGLSIGFTTLTIGHLNILSVVFTTILIGLGIDFGIHFILRYQEEKADKNGVLQSISNSLSRTGKGIIAGAITTSFAFMATMFADFKGISELGFIAGTGIIICLIVTITLLPAIIIIIERFKDSNFMFAKKFVLKQSTLDYSLSKSTVYPILQLILKKPGYLIIAGLISIAVSIFLISGVHFDYNILSLQADGTESVVYEKKIIEHTDQSILYGAVIVDRLEDVKPMKDRLELLPTVDTVTTVNSIIPELQDEKIEIIKKISALFNIPEKQNEKIKSVDIPVLVNTLTKISLKLEEVRKSLSDAGESAELDFIVKVQKLIAELKYLTKTGEKNISNNGLDEYQKILFTDFRNKLHSFNEGLYPSKIAVPGMPAILRERFVGYTGKYLLQVFPKKDIYARKEMEEFLEDIWSVDINATGPAITSAESSRLMKNGYIMGGVYAFIAIIIFIGVSFKNFRYTLLAISPLIIGALWTLAVMAIFNLQFNLANLIILPLIIGIGVDNGIHIVHRFKDDNGSGNGATISPVFKSTGKAIILSSLTTTIGFGSLMVASHRGIHSIGVLLTIGVISCMIASLTVLPAMLQFLHQRGWWLKTVN